VSGPQRDVVAQARQALQGSVLGAGELLGALGTEQVGTRRRTDDQRAAGEDAERRRAVQEQIGQVLIGVPGSEQGTQAQSP
jgi:hypothetical protein